MTTPRLEKKTFRFSLIISYHPRSTYSYFFEITNFPFLSLQYFDIDDLQRDFMQLCKNAQIYNEENSLIHEDSIALESVFMNVRQKLEAEGVGNMSEDEKGNLITYNFFTETIFFRKSL